MGCVGPLLTSRSWCVNSLAPWGESDAVTTLSRVTSHTARYSYLGPEGTFTWEALRLVPEHNPVNGVSVANVGEALDDVVSGRSDFAMIAMENSIEGGVSATQDALAELPGLRIIGEYQVPVRFALVAAEGVNRDNVTVLAAHPVAYAQCRHWLEKNLPAHVHVPSSSNVKAAEDALADSTVDAALAPAGITERLNVSVLAENVGDNPGRRNSVRSRPKGWGCPRTHRS